jgi:ATP-binding cassette subfamily B protein
MAEIKLNNCETYKRWEWQDIQLKIFNVNVASMRLLQYQDGGGLLINELKNILITFLTAMAVIAGDMTFGMMLSVQYLIGQLNGPVNDFINFSRDYQDARLSFDRINEIHSLPEEVTQSSTSTVSILYAKTILLENISFSYGGPHTPKVLDQLNLIIPEGKVTAIVGASGSGKTTLLKLLLRFFDPGEGLITIGGTDLRSLNPAFWRKQCGVVLQDGYIFSDTIARNIALADKSIDYARAEYAAELACISDVIQAAPNGFDTRIGSGGFGLSHGQKQRLLLARAIYKDPEFLFLDEATSALDANNERKIIGNLDRFFRGRTVIVVAHRLSTVKNADQIVVLDRGTITEAGTHRQLADSEGAYYHLVKNQLELGR